jgi:molybdate transport system ATP-binding protein
VSAGQPRQGEGEAERALEVDVAGAVGALEIDVAFRAAGAPLVIAGPNGSGKTSLLMMVLGAAAPRRGHVTLGGEALFDQARGVDVPVQRRRIGFLPQRYALFPHLDALRNVAYGIEAPSRAERAARALEALRELDAASLAARRPSELSGGEAQRVALARTLARRPDALLLDEPLAALDVSLRRDVRRFLAERLRAWRLPTVVVTHDPADVEALGGPVLVMERGAVVQTGTLAQIAGQPRTEFVRELVAGRGAAGGSRT